jgi:hypothetical protein
MQACLLISTRPQISLALVAVSADPDQARRELSLEPTGSGNSAILTALREGVRLALFRPVLADALVPSLHVLIALVLVYLAVSFGFQVGRVGLSGQFNIQELPRALFLLPLSLFCGLACAAVGRDASLVLRVAVAAVALSVALAIPMGLVSIALTHDWLPIVRQSLGWELWYTFLFWWAGALTFAIVVLVRAPLLSRLRAVAYGLVLLVAPVYWMPAGELWVPPYTGAQSADRVDGVVSESAFYAQQDLLFQAIDSLAPERPGIEDVYVLTAALFASEDVFMKEVGVISSLLAKRFDASGRTLQLINNRATLKELPIASLTSLRRALAAIGERMNPDEDVLVLYLSSHGSDTHHLAVDLWPLRLDPIDPGALRAAIDAAGIRWRVIVVSSCYSGGYVEPLKDERTLIITASSSERQSFGCGAASDFTYLAKALFDEELRKTHSFEAAFARARVSIAQRERAQGFTPSDPQIYVGDAIREKLRSLERRLAGQASHS